MILDLSAAVCGTVCACATDSVVIFDASLVDDEVVRDGPAEF